MSGGVDTGGLAAALTMVGAQGHVEDVEGEQAEMFAADAALPSMLPPAPPAKSGPNGGRPKGARNRSTEAWRELFLSKFRHPLMGLGELAARTPRQLAEEMQLYKFHEGKLVLAPVLDKNGVHLKDEAGEPRWQPVLATGEAFDQQVKAMIALLPYMAQKLPLAIEQKGDEGGLLVIGDLTVNNATFQPDQLPLADPPIDITPDKDGA